MWYHVSEIFPGRTLEEFESGKGGLPRRAGIRWQQRKRARIRFARSRTVFKSVTTGAPCAGF